jgi:hypothetical protein
MLSVTHQLAHTSWYHFWFDNCQSFIIDVCDRVACPAGSKGESEPDSHEVDIGRPPELEALLSIRWIRPYGLIGFVRILAISAFQLNYYIWKPTSKIGESVAAHYFESLCDISATSIPSHAFCQDDIQREEDGHNRDGVSEAANVFGNMDQTISDITVAAMPSEHCADSIMLNSQPETEDDRNCEADPGVLDIICQQSDGGPVIEIDEIGASNSAQDLRYLVLVTFSSTLFWLPYAWNALSASMEEGLLSPFMVPFLLILVAAAFVFVLQTFVEVRTSFPI